MASCRDYKDIKQVIIDEAQDYDPIHFEILKPLFLNARYTILGDTNQTIEKQVTISTYDDMQAILSNATSSMISMCKSFRCTNEILSFSTKLLDNATDIESFNRNGTPPEVIEDVASFKNVGDIATYIEETLNGY